MRSEEANETYERARRQQPRALSVYETPKLTFPDAWRELGV
jgi:hypothetical protein